MPSFDEQYELEQLKREVAELKGFVGQLREAGLDRLVESGMLQFDGIPFRWDTNGMQVATGGASTVAMYFLRRLSPTPANETSSARIFGDVDTTHAQLWLASYLGGGDAQLTLRTDGTLSQFQLYTALGILQWLNGSYNGTNRQRVTTDFPFRFASVTSDFSIDLLDGMLWYRSDTDKIRARINGATENLATESYVTAADAAHTGDTSDAHDASAISIADAGGLYTGTDVEAALAEIGAHPGDTSAAHQMTSLGAGNWKVFYSDGSGVVTELPLGASGEVLTSNGASSAPSFAAASSGGHTIRENGTDQTSRASLNFVDASAGAGLVVDDAGSNETEVHLDLYILKSLADAKGDIFAASAADTPARLAVGSDAQYLVADSSQSTGLGWRALFYAARNSNTSVNLTVSDQFTAFTASSPVTATLPTTPPFGTTLLVKNSGSSTVTVQRGGANTIYVSSSVTSVTLAPGEVLGFTFITTGGANVWEVW